MRLFLSWSGETSKEAAAALHSWLPTVIQTVRPYMSAESIDKGERWSVDISKQLEETHFGIICITPDNIEAPWVLFEAGALSKSMEKARVSPLLFGVGPTDFTGSPLLQFQLTLFKKDDFLKLLQSINHAAPDNEKLTPEVLIKSFERAWLEIETDIGKISFSAVKATKKNKNDQPSGKIETALDELLTISRAQFRVLRSPEEVLPPEYLNQIMERAFASASGRGAGQWISRDHPVWDGLETAIQRGLVVAKGDISNKQEKTALVEALERAMECLQYIRQRMNRHDFHTDSRRPVIEPNRSRQLAAAIAALMDCKNDGEAANDPEKS